MGQKSKADRYGLKEIIIKNYAYGKNTVAFVTEQLNEELKQKGLILTVSREAVRRVVRSHEEQVSEIRKNIEASKAIAEIFRDHPGTEMAEGTIALLAGMIGESARNTEVAPDASMSDLINDLTKLHNLQLKFSQYRTKATDALNKAKEKIKAELQQSIQNDPELIERLCKIVDEAKVK
ncbi:MAG: DUF3486 family protein [Treponema sp.]|jgi:hypothetical protein|nr:DUF3486 family protein [Treponema sp.]